MKKTKKKTKEVMSWTSTWEREIVTNLRNVQKATVITVFEGTGIDGDPAREERYAIINGELVGIIK